MARKKKTYEGLMRLVKSPLKQEKNGKLDKYSITPKGILLFALKEAYDMEMSLDSVDKLDKFIAILLAGLSGLASGGADKTLFGQDFNDFFKGYINILNLCGRMKAALDENGIEFDINPDKGDDEK